MPDEVFQSEAWFANLLAHGFERPPHKHWVWSLPSPCGEPVRMHLMQQVAGGGLSALSNYYSCLFGPTGVDSAVRGIAADQWQNAVRNLRQLPGGGVLRLQPLDGESAWLAGLERGLRDAGYRTDRFFCFGNWHQPVPCAGFAEYWQRRPSALRHSVERGRRRLDRAGGWRIDIHSDASPGLDEGLAAYLAVYASSWKLPEPCPDFMPSLVRMAAREGWLRLGVLWLGQKPLAAQVWLVCGGKASIYKLAYVQGQERYSVGSVLTAALMRHAMDVDKVLEVDYLSGDDAYKRDWMASRRERVGLLAFDLRRAMGLLAATKHFAGKILRRR